MQNKVRNLINDLNDHDYRTQFHPELSPLGWHLGHCLYIENYWLREVLAKDSSLTKGKEKLYIPEKSPKPERGKKLPDRKELIKTAVEYQDNNALLILEMTPPYSNQSLFKDEYIQHFIIQHYAQHYETMCMILQQRALQKAYPDYTVRKALEPARKPNELYAVKKGKYSIGHNNSQAYDNEQPRHRIKLEAFSVAAKPVSNAEYLAFMDDGGYTNRELWSEEGWAWLQQHPVDAPEHWRMDHNDNWFGITAEGPEDLYPDDAVYGINHYEASAFALWSNARLPHEHEWEVAATEYELPNTGEAWEWCANRFQPYPGFKPFPYDGYSMPWFDSPHYVLRGSSPHSRVDVIRPSFRNFFGPDKRHIFAGCRLAY